MEIEASEKKPESSNKILSRQDQLLGNFFSNINT